MRRNRIPYHNTSFCDKYTRGVVSSPDYLWGDFCTEILGRSFNTKASAPKFDVVHIPHDFDFEKPVKWWFVYDLHVTCNLDEKELLGRVSHHVHQASVVDNKW